MSQAKHRSATPDVPGGIVSSMSFIHRPLMRPHAAFGAVIALAATLSLAQAAPGPDAGTPPPTESLRPVIVQISQTLANVNVGRWKAPGEVKGTAQQDMDSINRDLSSTLPPLLDQAASSPGSIAATFAVYRNVDALYDVLLRVAQTATLSGAQNDAVGLQGALENLQDARKSLGNSLLTLATAHDQELVKLRAAASAAPAAKPATPASKVVDDGPQSTSSSRRRKPKPAANPQ